MDRQPQEDEAALVIRANRPSEVADRLASLSSIAGYPLERAPTQVIRDRYFDTADGALAARRVALRLREIDGSTLVTLKGPSRSTAWGSRQRLEIEEPWSHSTLDWIINELGDLGVSVRDRKGRPSGPVPDLERAGFEEIQHRETNRTVRLVISGELAAELAIDRVTYHLSKGKALLYEVEIEAKRADAAPVLDEVVGALDREWPEIERWSHSKLATGKALERVLSAGATKVLDEHYVVTPGGLDRIGRELGEAERPKKAHRPSG